MDDFKLLNRAAYGAIITKYHGATDKLGSRISATYDKWRVYIHYRDELSTDDNHKLAAEKLARKLDWLDDQTEFAWGHLPTGCVFVVVHQYVEKQFSEGSN